ncbi:hypothetical protein GCM10023232_04350 [Sphingosinicella ginsenosidimutans]
MVSYALVNLSRPGRAYTCRGGARQAARGEEKILLLFDPGRASPAPADSDSPDFNPGLTMIARAAADPFVHQPREAVQLWDESR